MWHNRDMSHIMTCLSKAQTMCSDSWKRNIIAAKATLCCSLFWVSYCMTTDWSQSSKGLSSVVLFPWLLSVQKLYLSPGNLVDDTTTLSQGKDLDLREVMAHKEVSSWRMGSARVCGQSQSWVVASSGLFTTDASRLDNGMCVQVA